MKYSWLEQCARVCPKMRKRREHNMCPVADPALKLTREGEAKEKAMPQQKVKLIELTFKKNTHTHKKHVSTAHGSLPLSPPIRSHAVPSFGAKGTGIRIPPAPPPYGAGGSAPYSPAQCNSKFYDDATTQSGKGTAHRSKAIDAVARSHTRHTGVKYTEVEDEVEPVSGRS